MPHRLLSPAVRAVSATLVAVLLSACNPVGQAIPVDAHYAHATPYFGSAASPQPLTPLAVPNHPFLAPQGRNGMHADAYVSQTYNFPGPLGIAPQVDSIRFGFTGGECATLTFDSQGRLMSVCTDFFNMRLVLMDTQLNILASHELPVRASNKTLDMEQILTDSSGGAYFWLGKDDKPIIANAAGHLQVFAVDESGDSPRWVIEQDYDLTPHLPAGSQITTALPDWEGKLWFITRQGIVGVVNPGVPGGDIRTRQLSHLENGETVAEEIQNSFASAEDGIYLVSDYALYRFVLDSDGNPQYSWRRTYDRGTFIKEGAINQGSGTTPTLLENGLIAITDNADSRINVLIYKNRDTQPELICQQPVFEEGRSITENSLIGYQRSIVVESNWGYDSPLKDNWTVPGLTRIDVNAELTGCDVVWENSTTASQTTVPKLSTDNGLIYVYTREPVPGYPAAEAYYLGAVDFRTGEEVFKLLTGTGRGYNNNWAPITLSQDGTAYVGTLNGLISVRDGQ